jgi:hypothetical protein
MNIEEWNNLTDKQKFEIIENKNKKINDLTQKNKKRKVNENENENEEEIKTTPKKKST